jgi:hypothetical protein
VGRSVGATIGLGSVVAVPLLGAFLVVCGSLMPFQTNIALAAITGAKKANIAKT